MSDKRELLGRTSAVKATMLQAHLGWADKRLGGLSRLAPHLNPEAAGLLGRSLSTSWIPFRSFIQIDRAIAAAAGGSAEHVFRELGRNSAEVNLGGVYKTFISTEPHRFFEQMGLLHGQFQNFGRSRYLKAGDRAGSMIFEGYSEYSPVYCTSAVGYFEAALRMMRAPGPLVVRETSCQCAGARECTYQMSW
jgi:uncharacterized protein (TIGR02265 family)